MTADESNDMRITVTQERLRTFLETSYQAVFGISFEEPVLPTEGYGGVLAWLRKKLDTEEGLTSRRPGGEQQSEDWTLRLDHEDDWHAWWYHAGEALRAKRSSGGPAYLDPAILRSSTEKMRADFAKGSSKADVREKIVSEMRRRCGDSDQDASERNYAERAAAQGPHELSWLPRTSGGRRCSETRYKTCDDRRAAAASFLDLMSAIYARPEWGSLDPAGAGELFFHCERGDPIRALSRHMESVPRLVSELPARGSILEKYDPPDYSSSAHPGSRPSAATAARAKRARDTLQAAFLAISLSEDLIQPVLRGDWTSHEQALRSALTYIDEMAEEGWDMEMSTTLAQLRIRKIPRRRDGAARRDSSGEDRSTSSASDARRPRGEESTSRPSIPIQPWRRRTSESKTHARTEKTEKGRSAREPGKTTATRRVQVRTNKATDERKRAYAPPSTSTSAESATRNHASWYPSPPASDRSKEGGKTRAREDDEPRTTCRAYHIRRRKPGH